MKGHVRGGQQAVTGSQVYLYAVSTTQVAGPATSLLKGPGYVTTGASGEFDITGDYTCPADAYVYLLATGGNPGLAAGTNNTKITLAAGLGACSGLNAASSFEINEVTTIALAYVVQGYATSETNIGAASAGALAANFAELLTFIDPRAGTALGTNPGSGSLPQAKINALANSLAACVNSTGVGDPCASLFADTTVAPTVHASPEAGNPGEPSGTFQAAMNVAANPTLNVAAIYDLGAASGPFQPAPMTAPADWSLPIPNFTADSTTTYTTPTFFAGQVDVGSGVDYLAFPNGAYFGYYSFLSNPLYIYHFDLGYEYVSDANDGGGGLYMYDFASGHTWYTSTTLFPYIYDYNLDTFIYYYPDPNNAGHYNTDGVRYFYNYATGQIFSM